MDHVKLPDFDSGMGRKGFHAQCSEYVLLHVTQRLVCVRFCHLARSRLHLSSLYLGTPALFSSVSGSLRNAGTARPTRQGPCIPG
jgi:hypothetical protein